MSQQQQNTKTPAMVLQELTMKLGEAPPEYDLVRSKMGTHENEFHYLVNVAGISATGFGRSKQVAKHDAAVKALELLSAKGLYDATKNPVQAFNAQSHRNESGSPLKPIVNYIGTLQDLCAENKFPQPIFSEISDVGPPHNREFTYECRVASVTTQAIANTKKQAKQLAAQDMLGRVSAIYPQLVDQMVAENALMATDQEAISKFDELRDQTTIIPDRTVEVKDYTYTVQKIMLEKNIRFEDLAELFHKRDFDSLAEVMMKLEIKFDVSTIQTCPCIVMMNLQIDTPFTLMACGENESTAKKELVENAFRTLEIFLTTSMEPDSSIF